MFADIAFLLVIAMLVIAAAQLYSGRGSGIGSHPYRHVWGGAPGADRDTQTSEDRDVRPWTRGAR